MVLASETLSNDGYAFTDIPPSSRSVEFSSPPALVSPTLFQAKPIGTWKASLLRIRMALGSLLYKQFFGGRLVRIGPHTIIKTSPYLRLAEAQTLDFVAKNTSIPVPRVFDVFTANNQLHIVMEYIDAPALEALWPRMSNEGRAAIVEQLRGFLLQLRALPSPHPGQIHAVDGSGLFDIRVRNKPFGPFDTIGQFNRFFGLEFIQQRLDKLLPFAPALKNVPDASTTLNSHTVRNILVKAERIVGIVDWECAGWYPEYWEYTSCHLSNPQCRSFWDFLTDEEVLGSYSDELAVDLHDTNPAQGVVIVPLLL